MQAQPTGSTSAREGELANATGTNDVIVEYNTDLGCYAPIDAWFRQNIPVGTLRLELDPEEMMYDNPADYAWKQFWFKQIANNVQSYNVVQTGPNTFTYSCKFMKWNLKGLDPYGIRDDRYSMRCPNRWKFFESDIGGELMGSIDRATGRGECKSVIPGEEWRAQYLQMLKVAHAEHYTLGEMTFPNQLKLIRSLQYNLPLESWYVINRSYPSLP